MKGCTVSGAKLSILALLVACTNCAIAQQEPLDLAIERNAPRKPNALSTNIRFLSSGEADRLIDRPIREADTNLDPKKEMDRSKKKKRVNTERRKHRKPMKGRKRMKRRNPRNLSREDELTNDGSSLRVQIKPFPSFVGFGKNRMRTISYKVYVLEGLNIRHYRVVFPSDGMDGFLFSLQQDIVRCIRRNYLWRCLEKPLRKKILCTDKVVKQCVTGFIEFEIASPNSFGRLRSSPLPTPLQSPVAPMVTAEIWQNAAPEPGVVVDMI